jgi:ABC-type Mn2+/Zn2+ transport system ATPase subunit
MVKALTVELENCYGIKKLKAQFDFSDSSACAIYAPNGSMKSSLAQTFQDIADGAASKDRIFPARAQRQGRRRCRLKQGRCLGRSTL